MNKAQILIQIDTISKELTTYTKSKLEDNNKEGAVKSIERAIENLNTLIYEIKRY